MCNGLFERRTTPPPEFNGERGAIFVGSKLGLERSVRFPPPAQLSSPY